MTAPHEINPLFFNRYRDNRGKSDLAPFFNNQEALWNKLEPTGSNPLKKHGVNVLTMRLLLAQDALGKMKDYEMAIKRKPGQYVMPPEMQTAASGVSNRVLYPDPSTGNAGEVISTETIRLHEYFYSFVSSLVSALDWLANEINAAYSLGIKRVDWGELERRCELLHDKNPTLEALIRSVADDPRKIRLFDCRNVSEHEGLVRIEEVPDLSSVVIDENYVITVADDPRNPSSPVHTPLIRDAKSLFSFVVESCCDAVYATML